MYCVDCTLLYADHERVCAVQALNEPPGDESAGMVRLVGASVKTEDGVPLGKVGECWEGPPLSVVTPRREVCIREMRNAVARCNL